MRQLYLDYNATTPIAPSVQEAMLPLLSEHFGNPSSSHVLGRAAAEAGLCLPRLERDDQPGPASLGVNQGRPGG